VTSATVNLGVKQLHQRPRPERVEPDPILGAGGAAVVAAAFDRLPRRSRR
jgi:hypothetical protein